MAVHIKALLEMKKVFWILILLSINLYAQNVYYYSLYKCDTTGFSGTYSGPEFNENGDIAHQFSNLACNVIGDKLKDLYKLNKYYKVDLKSILMSTEGLNHEGNVRYELVIPFKKVLEKCDSFTSFDHVGGWGHTPALKIRKIELSSALLKNDTLIISDLYRTKEGLEEFWIQWRNKITQNECQNTL